MISSQVMWFTHERMKQLLTKIAIIKNACDVKHNFDLKQYFNKSTILILKVSILLCMGQAK